MGQMRFLRWFVLALLVLVQLGFAQVHVRGYTRKDGTYVAPHYRSNPDGIFSNNWSTQGNVNPYTGAVGTKVTPPDDYGSDVYVRGYTRQNGTYVAPHYRSAPDGNPSNNWSTLGNSNPYTGAVGTKRTPLDDDSSDVLVRGYTRQNGTYVAPHFRSSPDGNPSNNWSALGNVNPHTGEPGRRMVEPLPISAAPPALERTAVLAPTPPAPRVDVSPPRVVPLHAPTVSRIPAPPTPAPVPLRPEAPMRKKTQPGTLRIGIQSGQRSPEILDVTVQAAAPGQLRFVWKELDQVVSVVASDESTPSEVVREYRRPKAGSLGVR